MMQNYKVFLFSILHVLKDYYYFFILSAHLLLDIAQ